MNLFSSILAKTPKRDPLKGVDMESTPYIQEIIFEGQPSISLTAASILAIVGPNNAGKTHLLKTIRSQLHSIKVDEVSPHGGLIKSLEIAWRGSSEESIKTLRDRTKRIFSKHNQIYINENGLRYPNSGVVEEGDYEKASNNTAFLGVFTDLFLEFDDALGRINETNLQDQRAPSDHLSPSLTQLARENLQASREIYKYFHQIFHRNISYYDRGYGTVGFLLSPEYDEGSIVGAALDEATKKHMDTEPKIWHQGLGMRSVLGLLLRIFAGGKEIIIIDEPEAFLHPPQASALGTVLSEIATRNDKQIILATHDRNIINGLTKNPASNIVVQRINIQNNERISLNVPSDKLNDVRNKSLTRYSPLLDSLFTRLTILVENEKDAFFYSEAIQHLLEGNSETYDSFSVDDILFLSTSGTGAMGRTADLITALHSNVIIACDFDILANHGQLKSTVEGSGNLFSNALNKKYSKLIEVLLDGQVVDQNEQNRRFKRLKGIETDSPEFNQRAQELLTDLDALGVCLNHLGELEDFAPELVGKYPKSEWAHHAIQEKFHQGKEAQRFAERILRKQFGRSPVAWEAR